MSVRIWSDILRERFRVEQQVREGEHAFSCADSDISYADKLAVLTEELGEVAREVNEHTDSTLQYARDPKLLRMPLHCERYFRQRLRAELVQVAQVAVAWIEAIDTVEESVEVLRAG
jgi:NTP pyrophosphatase (non-canonical NTP hydrolase)